MALNSKPAAVGAFSAYVRQITVNTMCTHHNCESPAGKTLSIANKETETTICLLCWFAYAYQYTAKGYKPKGQ